MVSLDAVVSKYNEALVKIAKRIGGQQASELDVSYINDVFRFAVERIEGCEPARISSLASTTMRSCPSWISTIVLSTVRNL